MLRRVLLEMGRELLQASPASAGLERVELLRIVDLFQYTSKRYAGVCKLRLWDRNGRPGDLVGVAGMTKVQVLSKERGGGFMVYVEGKPKRDWVALGPTSGGFLYPPFELTPDKWRMTFLGDPEQVRKFLGLLDRGGLRYRVVAAVDARFSPSSVLSVLTDRQREALSVAHRSGYYDIPRRADVRALARSLKIGKSAMAEHLRSAERRLVDEVFSNWQA